MAKEHLSGKRGRVLLAGFLILFFPALLWPQIPLDGGSAVVLEDREFTQAVVSLIQRAQKEVLMSMFLFKTDPGRNPARAVAQALAEAARRGVRVRVLLEREDEPDSLINRSNRKTAQWLLRQGVEVYVDSPRRRLHTKALVVDRHWVVVGSHNLTRSALRFNRELSLLLEDPDAAREVATYIEAMLKQARRVEPREGPGLWDRLKRGWLP